MWQAVSMVACQRFGKRWASWAVCGAASSSRAADLEGRIFLFPLALSSRGARPRHPRGATPLTRCGAGGECWAPLSLFGGVAESLSIHPLQPVADLAENSFLEDQIVRTTR
jgi:hypothetical protein